VWGWTGSGTEQGETVYRDDGVARSGMASAAISTNGADIAGAGWYMRLDELPLEHDVFFSGYIRTEGLSGGAYLRITLETEDEGDGGTIVLGWIFSETVAGDNDWTLISVDVHIPPETTGVWLEAGLSGRGRAWFDDLSLEVREPE
jgi:hypothetical protein